MHKEELIWTVLHKSAQHVTLDDSKASFRVYMKHQLFVTSGEIILVNISIKISDMVLIKSLLSLLKLMMLSLGLSSLIDFLFAGHAGGLKSQTNTTQPQDTGAQEVQHQFQTKTKTTSQQEEKNAMGENKMFSNI